MAKKYVNPVTDEAFECDVVERGKKCTAPVHLGWQPLGSDYKRVCENHWCRHCDDDDKFNLFDAFGLARPTKWITGTPKQGEPEPDVEYALDAYGELVPLNKPVEEKKRFQKKTDGKVKPTRKIGEKHKSKAEPDLKRDAIVLSILGLGTEL